MSGRFGLATLKVCAMALGSASKVWRDLLWCTAGGNPGHSNPRAEQDWCIGSFFLNLVSLARSGYLKESFLWLRGKGFPYQQVRELMRAPGVTHQQRCRASYSEFLVIVLGHGGGGLSQLRLGDLVTGRSESLS